MKRWVSLSVLSGALLVAPMLWAKTATKEDSRLRDSGDTLQAVLNAPDHGVPQGLLDHARCVIVMPNVVKAAFIVGGEGGHGVMTCRTGADFKGPWGAPAMMVMGGGSYGAQIGIQSTDFVLLVMTDNGAKNLLKDKVTLGADASAAAGPVGRSAAAGADITLQSDFLTYSRAKGLFAGVSLSGATLRPDHDANRALYGRDVTAQQIIRGEANVQPPAAADGLLAILQKDSPTRS